MTNVKSNQNKLTLWIRFLGKKLETRSVPIYELGEVLVSIQQIINKAYLYKAPSKKTALTKKEREKLALQISTRKKDSDAYGITSFLSDTVTQAFIAPIIVEALIALSKYGLKKIKEIFKKSKKDEKEIASDSSESDRKYIASIFPQIFNILRRIDAIGGITAIEIFVEPQTDVSIVVLKKEIKSYVKELKDIIFYDDELEIEGMVTRFNTRTNMVRVETETYGNVKVFLNLNRNDFQTIRYDKRRFPKVKFKAKPRFHFGRESFLRLEEFEAELIEILNSDTD
jgi:hypothetical protein